MKQIILACALSAIVLAGCSDSSTDSTRVDLDNPNGEVSDEGQDSGGNNGGGDEEDANGGESGGDNDDSDSGDSGNGGETDPEPPVTSACAATDIGIAFQAVTATVVSDATAPPSHLNDGCVDPKHSWSGALGSIVTLDAGAVHQMQGIYIWSTFARMEVLKIASSVDGLTWRNDFYRVPTKPVAGAVYYPLAQAAATRYVQVTGFGSQINDWTNLAEIRWSLTGYNVAGDRVLRNTTAEKHEGFSHSRHVLLEMTQVQTRHATYLRDRCPIGQQLSSADVTGSLNEFMSSREINGRMLYLFDWDHYPYRYTTDTDMFDYVLEPHDNYLAFLMRQPEYATNGEPCSSAGLGDALYSTGTIVQDLVQGRTQPNNGNWQ